jgi:hypothetical protein
MTTNTKKHNNIFVFIFLFSFSLYLEML